MNHVTHNFNRSDGYSERDLLSAAMDHLHSVSDIISFNSGCLDSAGYLGRLGLELLLKALLLHRSDGFPGIRSIQDLVDQCRKEGATIKLNAAQLELLQHLDRFSDIKYPDPKNPVSFKKSDLITLHNITHQILAHFPDSMIDQMVRVDEPWKENDCGC